MAKTRDEIIKELAEFDPGEDYYDAEETGYADRIRCIFCTAGNAKTSADLIHDGDCIWRAANNLIGANQ